MRRSNPRHSILAAAAIVAGLLAGACGGAASPTPARTAAPTPVITPDPHLTAPASVDQVFRLLGSAGLRITPNTATGGKGRDPAKRIHATYASWPLVLSEFTTPAALLAVGRFDPATPPAGTEAPYIVAGMNILIEFGPEVGRSPDAATDSVKRLAFEALVAALDPLVGPLAQRSVAPVTLPAGTPRAVVGAASTPAANASPAP
jgi:hypothetical protein